MPVAELVLKTKRWKYCLQNQSQPIFKETAYNADTLEILKELGIELGFKQIMSIDLEKGMKKINNSFLEIARQDHADILKRMN